MWNLIEQCWATDPKARPTAAQVLSMLPRVTDTRSLDTFDVKLASRISHNQSNHPFSLLAQYVESTDWDDDEDDDEDDDLDPWNYVVTGF